MLDPEKTVPVGFKLCCNPLYSSLTINSLKDAYPKIVDFN
jgi:hypothetical protein